MRIRTSAVAGLVLLSAGCSGGLGGGGNQPSTDNGQPVTAAPVVKTVNATKELDDVSCERGDDGWSFDGKIRNKTNQTSIYTVTVRIAPKKNENSTIGLTTVTKQVEAGKTVDFLAKNFSKLEAKGNTCIPIATKAA